MVYNVLIYMDEFIKSMDHMNYPLLLSGLSVTFSGGLWKRSMHLLNH